MEITINEALKRGVEAHKVGQIQEADRFYTAILQADPKHPHANHNMGVLAAGIGKVEEALTFFKNALEADSSIDQFWVSYCETLIQLNKLEDAKNIYTKAKQLGVKSGTLSLIEQKLQARKTSSINTESDKTGTQKYEEPAQEQVQRIIGLYSEGQLKKASLEIEILLKQFPNSAILFNILGASNSGLGLYELAVEQFTKALELNPDDISVYNNMGLALQNKGDNEAAINCYRKVLQAQPEQAETHNNMANALKDIGNIDESINSYKLALKFKSDFTVATTNLLSIEVQTLEHYQIEQDLYTDAFQRLLNASPLHHIYKSILDFIMGDVESCKRHLHEYSHLSLDSKTTYLKEKDRIFCHAYSTYLGSLTENLINKKVADNSFIYHIGESHCLSYAHCSIKNNEDNYTISPRITLGAKAHHFATGKENNFKAITRRNLSALPGNSIVFISIGEIDCRADEGIIVASEKRGVEITEIANNTVEGYISWFLDVNRLNGHHYCFFNIPAPMYDKSLSHEVNLKVASVVSLFNDRLKTKLLDYNINMVDVYEHTKNVDTFSNDLYHCDNRHLDRRILGVIQDQCDSLFAL